MNYGNPLDNPNKLLYVHHKDYNRQNNFADNLLWVTHPQNVKLNHIPSARKRIKKLNITVDRIVLNVRTHKFYYSIVDAAIGEQLPLGEIEESLVLKGHYNHLIAV